MNQRDRILEALREGPKTNRWFADNVCLRYSARISELRHDEGYIIDKRPVPHKNGLYIYELKGRNLVNQ